MGGARIPSWLTRRERRMITLLLLLLLLLPLVLLLLTRSTRILERSSPVRLWSIFAHLRRVVRFDHLRLRRRHSVGSRLRSGAPSGGGRRGRRQRRSRRVSERGGHHRRRVRRRREGGSRGAVRSAHRGRRAVAEVVDGRHASAAVLLLRTGERLRGRCVGVVRCVVRRGSSGREWRRLSIGRGRQRSLLLLLWRRLPAVGIGWDRIVAARCGRSVHSRRRISLLLLLLLRIVPSRLLKSAGHRLSGLIGLARLHAWRLSRGLHASGQIRRGRWIPICHADE